MADQLAHPVARETLPRQAIKALRPVKSVLVAVGRNSLNRG
jgi:hypothetical protein